MKQVLVKIAVAGGIICLSASAARAGDIEVATDHKDVLQELGRPKGVFHYGDTEIWLYEQGTVELLYGKVVAAKFLSPAALRMREGDRRERLREKSATSQLLQSRGLIEKRQILGNPEYGDFTAAELARVWDDFRRRYPSIPVDQPAYDAAVSEIEAAHKPAKPLESVKAAEDPGPPPKVSGKRIRKLKRAGKWKWGPPAGTNTDRP